MRACSFLPSILEPRRRLDQAFLIRPLQETGYAYVYLDATYLHGRLGKALKVCSRSVVFAMGARHHWGQAGDQRRLTRLVGILPNDPASGLRSTSSTSGWWEASCWSSRRNCSWYAAASSPRPPWPRSSSQSSLWAPAVDLADPVPPVPAAIR